jgi:hypothetical protein
MRWLQKIPIGHEEGYGFDNRGAFQLATLGQPIPMLTIDPGSVDLDGAIRDINTYRVPILVNKTYRALLTVASADGAFRIVGIGAAGLATELGEFDRNGIGPRKDANVYLLRVFQLRSDLLVTAPKSTNVRDGDFYPMRSARTFLDLSADPPAIGGLPVQGTSAAKMRHGELVRVLSRNFDRLTTTEDQ